MRMIGHHIRLILGWVILFSLIYLLYVMNIQFEVIDNLRKRFQQQQQPSTECSIKETWIEPKNALAWTLSPYSLLMTSNRTHQYPHNMLLHDSISPDFAWPDFNLADSHLLDEPLDEKISFPSFGGGALHDASVNNQVMMRILINSRPSKHINSSYPLLFIHIPKTAGTTVSKYLEENWKNYAMCLGIPRRVTRLPISKVHQKRKQSKGKCLYTVVWHRAVPITAFKKWVLTERVDFHYEHGHHPIGLCAYFQRDCHYTTVFREPIERTVSHYYYLRTLPEGFAPFVRELNYNYSTMDSFLDAVEQRKFFHYGLFNMHTLMLAGDGAWNFLNDYTLCNMGREGCDVRPDSLSWTHVDVAKRNLLRTFPIIGLTDRLVEYGVLMKLRYGYPFLRSLCGKENTNKQAHRNDSLTPQQIARIRHLNRFDIELYRFAEMLHEAQVREAGPVFQEELQKAYIFCANGSDASSQTSFLNVPPQEKTAAKNQPRNAGNHKQHPQPDPRKPLQKKPDVVIEHQKTKVNNGTKENAKKKINHRIAHRLRHSNNHTKNAHAKKTVEQIKNQTRHHNHHRAQKVDQRNQSLVLVGDAVA